MVPTRSSHAQHVDATLDPADYQVIWIAPLEIEARAALHLLDERHEGKFPVQRGDEYVFQAGSMCGYNVVIATLPTGQAYGTGSAAALASQAQRFFPNFWFGLLVGVAAGLPDLTRNPPRDIRLGDVLVSLPEGETAGLIAYDLGKETTSGFQPLRGGHVLPLTAPIVRSAIGSIKLEAPNDAAKFLHYYAAIRDKQHANGTFVDPGQDADHLFITQDDGTEERPYRAQRPKKERSRVWYGPIGAGDKLFRSAQKRDELRDRYGLIGLEMEAAGTMNQIPVGVIRGVCYYGDAHKNKQWQPYAAAMAAAYAKAVLAEIPPANKQAAKVSIGASIVTQDKPKEPCYHIQLSQNTRFTGRTEILATLDEKLFGEQPCQRAALVGLGGIGKTQVALRFAYRVKETRPSYSIFWVPVLSDRTTEQAFADIARKMGLQKTSPADDIKELVCRHLSSEEAGNWFMVVDNADDHELVFGSDGKLGIEGFLPQSEHGRILLTTRSGQVAEEFAQADVVDVEQMSPGEATQFIKKSLNPRQVPQDGEVLSQLLVKLTYLPLAIAQASAYLRQTKLPVHKYLALLQGAEGDVVKVLGREFRDNTRYPTASNAVATTWLVSFEQIKKSEKAAIDLLSFLSCVEPKAIPESMLPELSSVEEREWAIGVLCGYSFLVRRGDDTFDMHNLVHIAMRGWIEKQGTQKQVMEDALRRLNSIIPSNYPENRAVWQRYLPHALQVLAGSSELDSATHAKLCIAVGWCLHKDIRDEEAMKCFQDALRYSRNHLSQEDPARIEAEQAVAGLLTRHGQVETAIEIPQRAVAIRNKISSEEDHDRLVSEHGLATAYLKNQRVQEGNQTARVSEAIDLLENVMAVGKIMWAEVDSFQLASEYHLAKAYLSNDQASKALSLIGHVVEVRSRLLDSNDPTMVASLELLEDVHQGIREEETGVKL